MHWPTFCVRHHSARACFPVQVHLLYRLRSQPWMEANITLSGASYENLKWYGNYDFGGPKIIKERGRNLDNLKMNMHVSCRWQSILGRRQRQEHIQKQKGQRRLEISTWSNLTRKRTSDRKKVRLRWTGVKWQNNEVLMTGILMHPDDMKVRLEVVMVPLMRL